MISVRFRFYEELNLYLPVKNRKKWVEYEFIDRIPVFNALKQLHIPLEKVDLILINDTSVDLNTLINSGDRIAVYPVFELFDITDLTKLRSTPLRQPKFICDVHLGKLCKYLRMLGFDTFFDSSLSLDKLIDISRSEHRILLSRNNHISRLQRITHYFRIRSANADEQLKDLIQQMDLYNRIQPFSRCLQCNSLIKPVEKSTILNQLPPKIIEHFYTFYICKTCHKIYWKGSHYQRMMTHLNQLLET